MPDDSQQVDLPTNHHYGECDACLIVAPVDLWVRTRTYPNGGIRITFHEPRCPACGHPDLPRPIELSERPE